MKTHMSTIAFTMMKAVSDKRVKSNVCREVICYTLLVQ